MAVLTNRGILISALNAYSNPSVSDLLVIQDVTNNQTKKITVSDFITGALNNVSGDVNLTSPNNKFTGSFYVPNTKKLKVYGTTALGIKVNGNIESAALFVSSSATQGQVIRARANTIDFSANAIALTAAGQPNSDITLEATQLNVFAPSYFDQTITANNAVITNLTSTVTGNFFGGLYGDVYSATGLKILENGAGPVKDATFTGTSSYASRAKSSSHAKVADTSYVCVTTATSADTATSASYSLSGSFTQRARSSSYLAYSPNNGSASYAIFAATAQNVLNLPSLVTSASYALKSSTTDEVANDASGVGSGSFNLAFFSQSRVSSNTGLSRVVNGNGSTNFQFLALSSSRYLNALVISSRGYSTYGNQAAISFYNLNNSKSYPNISGYTIGSYYSGSLTFIAPLGSAEFSSSTRVAVGSATETYTFVSKRSGYYFWPYMTVNTPSREGSIGIGVQPPGTADSNPNLLAKLHLRCFSSSKAHVGKVTGQTLTGTVKLPEYAIYVDYGSSSYNPLFSVGASGSNAGDVYASGDVEIAGDLTVDGNLNATLGYGESTANAFGVRYTTGCITYGKYVYFTQLLGSSASGNQDSPSNYNRLLRLNQQTNEITIIIDFKTAYSGAQTAHAGHLSLLKFVNQGGYNEDNILFVDHNGYVNVVGDLLNATMPSRIYRHSIGNGGYGQWRVAYVDTNSPASNTNPDFYLLPDSFNTSTLNNGIRLIKASTTGPTVTQVGSNLNLNSTINATWAAPQLLNGGTSYYYRVLTMIYNPNSNKRRLYVVGNATGLCDIYNLLGYSSDNIATWWAQADATRYPQLQYEKTIVIPQPGSNYWADANWESYGLEYDTTTGAEKFWSWNRVGNGLLTGTVGKAPFYGS